MKKAQNSKRKQAKKAIKESEEKFRRIFNDSPIGIELYDREGNLLDINKAILQIFGISDINNIIKYNFFEDPNTPENIKKNLESGKISRFEKIYDFDKIKKSKLFKTSKSGIIYHDVLVSPLFLEREEKFSHFLVQVQDITLKKLSEQKLKESEENYRNLINNISDAIVKIDLNGMITYLSPQMYDIFGFQEKELIGSNALDFAHPEDVPRLIKVMKEVVNSKEILYLEFRVRHKNGKYVPVAARGSTIKEEGKLRIICVLRDITERKKAEQLLKESEEKYRLITENSYDLIRVLNDKFELEYINEFAHLKILGYKKEDIIGKFSTYLNHPEDYKRIRRFMLTIFKTGEALHEIRIKNKNGHWLWFEVKAKSFKDNKGKQKYLLISREITERKKAEEKLKESEMRHRLAYNKADFYKDLFAHDMNNILHNILSSVELYYLCQKNPEKMEKGDELLGIIKAQAKRGEKLISNVQTLSRIEESEIQTEKVDLYGYLREAIKFVKESFQDRNINILIDAETEQFSIQANKLLLDVFENILLNSVKYNNNSSVLINIKISKEIKDEIKYVKLQFIDNGIGIPDSRKETIFNRSYSKDRILNGMGIGLSLVRSIVYGYNGYITVEDKEPGDHTKGSNFIIFIPAPVHSQRN